MTDHCPLSMKIRLIQKAIDRGNIHSPRAGSALFLDDDCFMWYEKTGWTFWYNDKEGSTHCTKEKE